MFWLYNQEDQAWILPALSFSITPSSWASHLISPISASSSVKYLHHKLIARSQRNNKCKISFLCSQLFTIIYHVATNTLPTELFPSTGWFSEDKFSQNGLVGSRVIFFYNKWGRGGGWRELFPGIISNSQHRSYRANLKMWTSYHSSYKTLNLTKRLS